MGFLIDASILIDAERGRLDLAAKVAHGLTLITGNTREFARVPGLRLETWCDA